MLILQGCKYVRGNLLNLMSFLSAIFCSFYTKRYQHFVNICLLFARMMFGGVMQQFTFERVCHESDKVVYLATFTPGRADEAAAPP